MMKALCAGLAALVLGCSEPARDIPSAYAQAVPQPVAIKSYHPAMLDMLSPYHGERVILIDKQQRNLDLYEYHGTWHRKDTHPIAVGKGRGPKTRQGDMRTPEGDYRVEYKMTTRSGPEHSSYLESLNMQTRNSYGYIGPNAFGEHALMLDYPNSDDRRRGSTGSGIMIHSVPANRVGLADTGGCIGLAPSAMESVYNSVGSGTRVIIRDSIR
jgi:murein L,D-transpeptidase YafK